MLKRFPYTVHQHSLPIKRNQLSLFATLQTIKTVTGSSTQHAVQHSQCRCNQDEDICSLFTATRFPSKSMRKLKYD